jgi:mRNA-degrading endonuclease RelE of RelBE toxin-antitoxin system
MRLEVHWHPAALAALYRVHWRTGAAIDAQVIRFAETGQGEVERIPPRYRLRAGAYDVIFVVDRGARALTVLWFHRAR